MLKVLKVNFEKGNQTLDVPDNCEIVANLYADLKGTVLLIRVPNDAPASVALTVDAPAITPEVVNPPDETGLES